MSMSHSFLPREFRVQKRANNKSIIGAERDTIISTNEPAKNGNGAIKADIPSMTAIFMILDPTTFPTAISEFHRLAAMIDVTSSGALVPTATIVSPMID